MTLLPKFCRLCFLSGILIVCFAVRPAYAGCSNPSGNNADLFYNGDYHTYQFCNGTVWVGVAYGSGGTGGGGCSSPAGVERDIMYNGDYHTYQFCSGAYWVQFGGLSPSVAAGSGFFVMSKSTWTGNLGGSLAAINAKCLTELTTNTGWKGYADANARGVLISAKVKAFICGNPSCNTLSASTTYYFANAADSNLGGNSFTTDGTGAGPGDTASWGGPGYFGSNALFWSDVAHGTATAWDTSGPYSSTAYCSTITFWDTGTNAKNGTVGTPNLDTDQFGPGDQRWYTGTTFSCDHLEHLICFVNP